MIVNGITTTEHDVQRAPTIIAPETGDAFGKLLEEVNSPDRSKEVGKKPKNSVKKNRDNSPSQKNDSPNLELAAPLFVQDNKILDFSQKDNNKTLLSKKETKSQKNKALDYSDAKEASKTAKETKKNEITQKGVKENKRVKNSPETEKNTDRISKNTADTNPENLQNKVNSGIKGKFTEGHFELPKESIVNDTKAEEIVTKDTLLKEISAKDTLAREMVGKDTLVKEKFLQGQEVIGKNEQFSQQNQQAVKHNDTSLKTAFQENMTFASSSNTATANFVNEQINKGEPDLKLDKTGLRKNELKIDLAGKATGVEGGALAAAAKTEIVAPTSQAAAVKMESKEPIDMKQWLGKVKMMLSGKKSEMVMKMSPEHMGKMKLKLIKEGDVLTAKFSVESIASKEALESQIHHLQKSLSDQGVQIQKVSIELMDGFNNGTSFASTDSQQQQSGKFGYQSGNNQPNLNSEDPVKDVPVHLMKNGQSPSKLNIYA